MSGFEWTRERFEYIYIYKASIERTGVDDVLIMFLQEYLYISMDARVN